MNKITSDALKKMSQDEYFAMSEGRTVITPENIGGLVEYPALFHAMIEDRELRPALSPAMSTGRAMNDFLTCSAAEFESLYTIEAGPTNPKTGNPYGTDTKAYLDWAAKLDKKPVTPKDHRMFGKMAAAYEGHNEVMLLKTRECVPNAVFGAEIAGVQCLAKIDKLYVSDTDVVAVDVKTTDDILSFERTADRLHYREQQALISLILKRNGLEPATCTIAAIEKSSMPRCGIFRLAQADVWEDRVAHMLADYATSCASGSFSTLFEKAMYL